MKTIIAIMMLVIVAGCKAIPVNPPNIPPAVVEFIEKNTWKLRTDFGSGTAFWIDQNHLATNCHVVNPYKKPNDTEPATVESWDRRIVLPVKKVLACDQEKDLAILYVEETLGFVPMETSLYIGQVPRGTRLYSGGYSKGGKLQIQDGFKQGPDPILGPNDKFLGYGHSVHTIMGDSGSSLLIYHEGKVMVIGVRSAVSSISMGGFARQYLTHIALYRPAQHILDIINSLK